MKKILAAVLCLMLVLSVVTPAMAEDNIKVELDEKQLEFDVQPIEINGRVLVPVRVIFEALGASVFYDDQTRTVMAIKDNHTVVIQIDGDTMYVNNEAKVLDVPAMEIDGRTLVPVRAVSEAFGVYVDWIDATQTVVLNTTEEVVVATVGDQNVYKHELDYLMTMGATKEQALEEIRTIKTMVVKANEYGVVLTEEDNEGINQQWNDLCAVYGSEENLNEELKNYGVTGQQYRKIVGMLTLCDKFAEQFENLGLVELTSEETAEDFYNENFLRAKHILFMTVDDSGMPLDSEKITQAKGRAQETLEKIRAGIDFEKLEDLSEDPGSLINVDGYIFYNTRRKEAEENPDIIRLFQQMGVGVMVEPFEQGTAALDVGEVSDIVESEYGYHIIKRLELSDVEDNGEIIVIQYVLDTMNNNALINQWVAEIECTTNENYEAL